LQHKFYWSLAILCLLNRSMALSKEDAEVKPDYYEEAMTQVANNQAQLEKWAKCAPLNYQHKFDLIEALRACITGNPLRAMELFDAAIDGAQKSEIMQDEALARELTGEFYYQRSTPP